MNGTNDFDDFEGGWGSSSSNEFGSDFDDSNSNGSTDNVFGNTDFGSSGEDSENSGWGSSSNNDFDDSVTSADFEDTDWGNIDEVPASNGSDSDFENEKVAPVSANPNYGYKTIGMIIACALLVVAVVLVIVSKVNITRKDTGSGNAPTSQSSQVSHDTKSNTSGTDSKEQQTTGGSSLSLKIVPDSTSVDTSGEVMESEGTVTGLKRYLQDGQVIYCVDISMGVGMGTTVVHYYCGYNIFSELEVGNTLTVSYQKVSEECFSVNTISK